MPILWLKDAVQASLNNNQSQGQMKYSLKLAIKDPKIFDLIKTEIKNLEKTRSKIAIKKTKNGFEIDLQARDAVALRASINSITQLLKVYEKVQTIK